GAWPHTSRRRRRASESQLESAKRTQSSYFLHIQTGVRRRERRSSRGQNRRNEPNSQDRRSEVRPLCAPKSTKRTQFTICMFSMWSIFGGPDDGADTARAKRTQFR